MRSPARFGVVILAAGQSARMGQPKQLLPFEGKALVVRTVEAALASDAWPVVVVIGAHGSAVRATLTRYPVLIAENPAWAEGMASSLRTGIATLVSFSRSLEGAVVALCDQPGFSAETVRTLIEHRRESGRGIAAARYADRLGAPALFTARYFSALQALSGDEGARQVLQSAAKSGDVAEVFLPALEDDVDTPEDYRRLHPGGERP